MKKRLSLWLLLICSHLLLFAQNRQLSGVVVSADDKQPVLGTTVTIKGTKTSAVTDAQGRYTIEVNDNAVLVFSHSGFIQSEVSTRGKTTVNVELQQEVRSLDDVVVIGYQTVKRKDLTSSVSSVSARDLKDIPINSAEEALT